MPLKSNSTYQTAPSSNTTTTPAAVCSEQWWRAAQPTPFPLTDAGVDAPKHTLLNHPVEMSGSKDDQSLSNPGDDDETSKDSETTGSTSTPRGMVLLFRAFS